MTDVTTWEHHRNGVGGRPFRVTCDEHNLRVAFLADFDPDDWDEKYDEPITVPLSLLRRLASEEPDDDSCRGIVADHVAVAAFDREWEVGVVTTMVAVQLLDRDLGDRATAVFALDLLPDVRFGHNSWRGDHQTGWIHAQLAKRRMVAV